MGLAYRLGWPFARTLAAMGMPMLIRIEAMRDNEAGVFVARSPDVDGLVLEADSLEGLMNEARLVLPDLLWEPRGIEAVHTTMRMRAYQPAA